MGSSDLWQRSMTVESDVGMQCVEAQICSGGRVGCIFLPGSGGRCYKIAIEIITA